MFRLIHGRPFTFDIHSREGIRIVTLGQSAISSCRDHNGQTCFQDRFRIPPALPSLPELFAKLPRRWMAILRAIHRRSLR